MAVPMRSLILGVFHSRCVHNISVLLGLRVLDTLKQEGQIVVFFGIKRPHCIALSLRTF